MLASTRLRLRSARHGASRKSGNGSNVGTSGRIHVRHAHNKRVLGIRREDPQRIWERRCPLTPEAVERLVNEHNVEVLVQPCDRRIFKTEDFVKAGAKVHPTLSPADVLIGIKETPLEEVLTDPSPSSGAPRTHIMFSHTHKGQTYNAPLLSKFLEEDLINARNGSKLVDDYLLPTLVDWELLTDENGKRTVGFGWYAGVAGVIEGLVSTAHLHLSLGVASPFLGTPRPHTAPLPSLLASLRQIGNTITQDGTPKSMGPFVVVVTGSGQVSNGALSVLRDTLPIQDISVDELPHLVRNPDTPLNKVYLLHATQDTYLFHQKSGERAKREAYYADPSSYESRFHELIAPYMTYLVNGVGWTLESPRLMSIEQTADALMRVQQLREEIHRNGSFDGRDVMKGRCLSYADISCDIEGGLGFLTRSTTLSEPSYKIDLRSTFGHVSLPSATLPSLQVMSVDILPTALPLEASRTFCDGVLPYVRNALGVESESDKKKDVKEALERATIASGGKLRERHIWLKDMVDKYRKDEVRRKEGKNAMLASDQLLSRDVRPAQGKKVLLLGSGMVAGPTVEEICKRPDVELVIASDQAERNASLCLGKENASSVIIDINERERVQQLVKEADVVISLLPVPFHPSIAEMCIENKKHLITASYISPAMRSLHERAVKSDVLLLNEIGLDPGIDHCSAFSLLADLRKKGKVIESFASFCGGLPAPDCADVPLKYKFSWSPRGVLSAALNGAQFLVNGKKQTIPGDDLLISSIPQLPVSDILQLEGLPNRDSLAYASTYKLSEEEGLKTLFRGTLRYPGFSRLLWGFKRLGLLDTDVNRKLNLGIEESMNLKALVRESAARRLGLEGKKLGEDTSLRGAVKDLVGKGYETEELFEAVEWLSRDDSAISSSLKGRKNVELPAIDHFANILARRLAYKEGERDLVLLHHEIVTTSPNSSLSSDSHNGNQNALKEVHTSALEVYGDEKHSAMAQCVGIPVALATLKVIDDLGDLGREKSRIRPGVWGPEDPELYNYVLRGMEQRGLRMIEKTRGYGGKTVEGQLRFI